MHWTCRCISSPFTADSKWACVCACASARRPWKPPPRTLALLPLGRVHLGGDGKKDFFLLFPKKKCHYVKTLKGRLFWRKAAMSFWTMRSRRTRWAFYHFLIKLWTDLCPRRQWEHDWVFQSVQTGKNSQDVVFFLFLSLLSVDPVMFRFSKEGE